ncbi:MAG: hypothetical protein DMG67_05610 [Acidobacteria bacterium]|nr:MAG: hypothetical protein DMG67_05610 [Acidobacteriota bacterium]
MQTTRVAAFPRPANDTKLHGFQFKKAVGKTLQFVVLLRPLSRPIIFNNSHAFHNLQNVSREHFDDQKVAARQGNDITLLISLVGKYRA